MRDSIREHKKAIAALILILSIAAFITYSVISPQGFLSGLQNDLKIIENETVSGYTDMSGNPVSLKSFKGKPLIINSWATWMPFSKDELLLLSEMKSTYGDEIGIIAMNRKEDVGMVRAFLSTYNISGDVSFLLDPNDNFYTTVGGYAMPETLFYSADGTLVLHTRGVLTRDDLLEAIQGLQKE